MSFRTLGLADVVGGGAGAAAGVVAALLNAGIWSMAVQVFVTDVVIAVMLISSTRRVSPNLHLGLLREILPFSLRIFGSNSLAFMSRNLDNILVGRVLGVTALSHYSMAYRVLVIPVQMIGQTVNRVTFPTFSRLVGDQPRLARSVGQVTELLAFATIPAMLGVAVAAPELIHIVLGPQWAATAPVLTVLSVAGARETVFSVTQSLLRAKGAGKQILRYELLATGTQLTGIIVGLQFGLIGVALGLMLAGFCLSPIMLVLQRQLSGVSITSQVATILRPAHAALWGVAVYLLVQSIGWSSGLTLLSGTPAYLVACVAVLRLAHRPALKRSTAAARTLFAPRRSSASTQKEAQTLL
jgi:PST family polysaccharide transporter